MSGRIAVIQMRTGPDLAQNIRTASRLVSEASSNDVQAVFLPEAYSLLAPDGRTKFDYLESAANPGPTLKAAKDWATAHNLWVFAGGIAEPGPNDTVHNTFFVIDPRGHIAGTYSKMHLFDVDIPGKVRLVESDDTTAGKKLTVIKTPFGNVGLSICYDMRFPELYRRLVCDMEANILAIPAAFTVPTGRAHWHTLLRARAIENQCYVIAAAQWGRHHHKRVSYGHSLVVDPWGDIIAEQAQGEGVIYADIDLNYLASVRKNLPCLSHRQLTD